VSNVIQLPKSSTQIALEKLKAGLDKGMTPKEVEANEWMIAQEQFAIEAHIKRLGKLTSQNEAIRFVVKHVNWLMECGNE